MVHVLELELSRGGARGDYVVQVVRSPAGEASATFTLDSDRLLDQRPNLQNALLLSSVSSRSGAVSGNEGLVQTVGRELFEALFGPKSIAGLYAASRALADATQEELRIVLRTGSPELAALPWEVMYDTESDTYVCRREPLVRHVPVARVPPPLRVRGALRILGIISSPRGMAVLDVDQEKDNLESALAGPAKRGLVDLQWAPDASWNTLQELLLSDEWHVVHFIGHGGFDFEREEGILALVGKDGRANRVEGRRFVDLLRQARPMPRLVVLNACSSATSSSEDLFSGTAAALVRGGVSAVAAMQFAITDYAAIQFCQGFYNAIAHGRGVDEAVGSGRVAILGSSRETLEWVTPVLYLRGRDSQLFAIERAGEGATAAVASTEERVAQAQEAIDQHHPTTAIPVLDAVLADDPENAPARELRAVAVEDVRSEFRAATEPKLEAVDYVVAEPAAPAPGAPQPAASQQAESPAAAISAPSIEEKANAQNLVRARLRVKAKETPWRHRPQTSELIEMSTFIELDEALLGLCHFSAGLLSKYSYSLVITDRHLYLRGDWDDTSWVKAWKDFPATVRTWKTLVRIPIGQVESCEYTDRGVLNLKGRGFAVNLAGIGRDPSLTRLIEKFMASAKSGS